jgi:hypothetical protein
MIFPRNAFHEEQFVQRYKKYVHKTVTYKGAKREETAKERNVKLTQHIV